MLTLPVLVKTFLPSIKLAYQFIKTNGNFDLITQNYLKLSERFVTLWIYLSKSQTMSEIAVLIASCIPSACTKTSTI